MNLNSDRTPMRLAVVGTSHVACIQAAFSESPELRARWGDVFYFAINAPMLSKQNYCGWPEPNGVMSCTIPEARTFLKRVFGDPERRFVPSDYDVVLLVDFFHCYDFSFQLCDNAPWLRVVSGAPVSESVYREVIKDRLGKSWYGVNGPLGEVPANSVMPLLRQMRASAPNSRIYLTGRPAQPVANISARSIKVDFRRLRSGMAIFEEAASQSLAEVGINFLPRHLSQICPETGLTPNEFSVGSHPTLQGALDEHVNAKYGRVVVESMSDDLHQVGVLL